MGMGRMNSAVEQAINCIWERYDERLTLSDIARSAILSKFHFCRIFSQATGISPRRYLSAVRIYQAKRLLVTMLMNVIDISFSVGFNSLGSFTNHFTDSVGVSPGRFRRVVAGRAEPPAPVLASAPAAGIVSGTIVLPDGHSAASMYVGIFKSAIVEGLPAAADIFSTTSGERRLTFSLKGVPAGDWFVHAVAVAESVDPEPWTRRVQLLGGHGPIRTGNGTRALASISLRGKAPTDLPVLFALPNLEAALDDLERPDIRSFA